MTKSRRCILIPNKSVSGINLTGFVENTSKRHGIMVAASKLAVTASVDSRVGL